MGVREILCIAKELVERRAGARCDNIEGQALNIFHAGVANFRVQPKSIADFLQKFALLGRRFEQRDPRSVTQKFSQDEAGESSPAAEIGECFGILRYELDKLGTIPNVPPPHIGERVLRDEVMAAIPALQ